MKRRPWDEVVRCSEEDIAGLWGPVAPPQAASGHRAPSSCLSMKNTSQRECWGWGVDLFWARGKDPDKDPHAWPDLLWFLVLGESVSALACSVPTVPIVLKPFLKVMCVSRDRRRRERKQASKRESPLFYLWELQLLVLHIKRKGSLLTILDSPVD